jgi:hypothetical protein
MTDLDLRVPTRLLPEKSGPMADRFSLLRYPFFYHAPRDR